MIQPLRNSNTVININKAKDNFSYSLRVRVAWSTYLRTTSQQLYVLRHFRFGGKAPVTITAHYVFCFILNKQT